MAYTISIVHVSNAKTARVVAHLKTKINEFVSVGDWQEGIRTNRKGEKRYVIEMRSIRLRVAKLYCGQHAGPCQVERKLKMSRCLETHDWIDLHKLVNDRLDARNVKADITTTRVDTFRVKGFINKFLIRTVEWGARKRYDYINGQPDNLFGIAHYVFNPGTRSQFESGSGVDTEEVYEEVA